MDQIQHSRLIDDGLALLRGQLGPGWKVEPVDHGRPEPPTQLLAGLRSTETDALISIASPDNRQSRPILVEAKVDLRPSQIKNLLAPRVELMRRVTGDAAVLVISSWLSPRTRDVLDELGYGYLDLTGNISFRLNQPGLFMRLTGGQRDPRPGRPQGRTMAGERAGVLIRALIDVRPPYRAVELVQATGLSGSYVSRLLDLMETDALVDRRRDGEIANVDWNGLIRARAKDYRLLKANGVYSFVAAKGASDVLALLAQNLHDIEVYAPVALTGTYAADALAPLAIGGQLMIYADVRDDEPANVKRLARTLRLMPAMDGISANVLLLSPTSLAPHIGRRLVNGIPHVAPSQLVLDCLGGSGRMPAEGEEILTWMIENENQWRSSSFADWNTRIG